MAGVVDIAPYRRAIRLNDLYAHYGKVEKIVGMMVEATGVTCNIGDVCNIQIDANNSILAEAVGLKEILYSLCRIRTLQALALAA